MKENHYDVIVVGAGPAGTAAASVLAASGSTVLLIDRCSFPREKLCGGSVTGRAADLLSRELGISQIKQLAHAESDGFEIYYKDMLQNSVHTGHRLLFFSRCEFDHLLLQHAQKAGADFLPGSPVREISENSIEVEGSRYSFNYLIGADGVHSTVRKSLGLSLDRRLMALSLQADIDPDTYSNEIVPSLPRIHFGCLKYGWAWIFPKGERVTVGMAGLHRYTRRMIDPFQRFLKEQGIEFNKEKSRIRGAWIPYGTCIKRPAFNNRFLTGDAAGFADPITGEGIYFALLSGILAARSILSGKSDPAGIYISGCGEKIIRHIRHARYFRHLLFRQPFQLIAMSRFRRNKKFMRLFMDLISGEIDYLQYAASVVKDETGIQT